MFGHFLQTLIDALAVGSLYALIALGYTMVYGILKFINFAHSDIFVLGAWTSFAVATSAGWGGGGDGHISGLAPWLWWAICIVSGVALLAATIEFVLHNRRRAASGGAGGGGAADDFSLRRTAIAGTFTLAAIWGWCNIGLFFLARLVKQWGDTGLFSGLIILITAMSTCGLVGFLIERFAYKPLRSAPRLNVLITAIGVSLLLQNLGQTDFMFGTRPQPMPTLLPNDKPLATIAGVNLWPVDVIGAGTAVALMFLLDWLVYRTRFGRQMRAVSFSPTNASLMGIPVDRVVSITFVIGAALAAAAGFLFGQKYAGLTQPAAATWVLLGLKAFVAAVVGGIGNIRGAMLGGILIGLLEFFGVAYISPAMRDVYVFSLLILVLLIRPSGILGKSAIEKV